MRLRITPTNTTRRLQGDPMHKAVEPIRAPREYDIRFLRGCIGVLMTFCVALASAEPNPAPAPPESAPVEIEPPMRELWSRGSARFHRQWLVADPVAASSIAGIPEAALTPAAGQALHDTLPAVQWQAHKSWGDVFDVTAAIEAMPAQVSERYIYVSGTFTRRREGAADLLIGAKAPLTVWLDNEQVYERTDARAAFTRDSERIAVRMKEGENTVVMRLLQTEHGPMQLSARVVEPGAVVSRAAPITPVIVAAADGALRVQTHLTMDLAQAPVDVQAIAAGGRVQASRRAARGETIELDAGAWPDGAYELRFETKTAWGEPAFAYLPWYKGDAIAAAKRLVEASRAAQHDTDGATLRVLAAIVQDRAGEQFERVHAETWKALHSVLLEYEELQLDRAGKAGRLRANGFIRLAYTDDVDGSVQFCRAYLPPRYSAAQRWPTVIQLHGYNPANPPYHGWWSVDARHSVIADNKNVIYIEPHGRGNAQYLGFAEDDVLRCIEQAKARLSVDEDRVYLMGESMGGHGTWSIASRNPHLFAAAAPVYGGWDFRVTSVSGPASPDAAPTNAREFFHQERISSFSNAESLLNVPLYVLHGDQDAAVSVENSRHAVRMLQRWGYDIRYHEMPGWEHEDLNRQQPVVDWLLTHSRNTAPRHVRVRSADLAAAHAHWLRVDAMLEPVRVIRADAQVLEPGRIRLDTDNVAELTLTLPAALRGSDSEVEVIWNGQRRTARAQDGSAVLALVPEERHPLRKRAGLEGPISDIVNTPFLVVIGTTASDPQMRKYCRERGEELQARWHMWQHQPLRMLTDTEVTPEHERAYSLILLGGAEANAVTRRISKQLPLEVTSDSIQIGPRRFSATDAVAQMIYPSPHAEDRYVLVVAATSSAGMWLWQPTLFDPTLGIGLVNTDWTIEDGRRPPPNTQVDPVDRTIATGTFDAYWRHDERWVTEGSAVRRAEWRVRQAPAPGYVPTLENLERYAGRYEFPQFTVTLTLQDGKLMVQVPGEPIFALEAVTETVFRMTGPASGIVEALVDADGSVIGVEVDTQGQFLYGARKVPE